MNIENNILKHYLKNCMFITGTAYAGKSTMCAMLAEKHGLYLCGENYKLDEFLAIARPELQPHLCYQRKDWQEFLNRSPKAYEEWIYGGAGEIAGFEIAELIRVSGNQKVIVDTNIPVDVLREIADYNQVAVMLSPQSMSIERFFDRNDPDKIFILEQIQKAKDPEKTMANYRECLARVNSKEHYDEYANSGFFTLVRQDTEKDTKSEMLAALERHFGLV
jgi:hypothetical protein